MELNVDNKKKDIVFLISSTFLFLSIPILLQKEQLILNLKDDTKDLLLDGLGGLRTLIIAGFGNIINKVLVS